MNRWAQGSVNGAKVASVCWNACDSTVSHRYVIAVLRVCGEILQRIISSEWMTSVALAAFKVEPPSQPLAFIQCDTKSPIFFIFLFFKWASEHIITISHVVFCLCTVVLSTKIEEIYYIFNECTYHFGILSSSITLIAFAFIFAFLFRASMWRVYWWNWWTCHWHVAISSCCFIFPAQHLSEHAKGQHLNDLRTHFSLMRPKQLGVSCSIVVGRLLVLQVPVCHGRRKDWRKRNKPAFPPVVSSLDPLV